MTELYRKQIDTTPELAEWYNQKYIEMGDGWHTPPEESNKHLNDLGVPFDRNVRLLDVGCGAGHFLMEADKRCSATGIDISYVGIDHCLKRNLNAYCDDIAIVQPPTFTSYFDYVVSLGSLEHVVDLDRALDNICAVLKPNGQFYFFCPNETWKHFDQPNERTMSDGEWMGLFERHGLYVHNRRRWNDSTAFWGDKIWGGSADVMPPNGNKLNIGSGQRRFDNKHGWINIDCVARPGQVPDLICNVGVDPLPYPENSMDVAVLHQVYEHFGLGEGHGVLRHIHRTLKPGASLIITVPSMRTLAEWWLSHQIDDYTYFVNVYGAYQGEPGDRHKWGYSAYSLIKDLTAMNLWSQVKPFNWRDAPGADIARDWWILGMECIK